jgi:hypothetical protein
VYYPGNTRQEEVAVNPIIAALLLPLAACSFKNDEDDKGGIAPTGSGTSRSFTADGFTEVELAGHDDVDVKVGSAFSVTAEGPAEELDRLKIEREGSELKIGRKRGNWGGGSRAKVRVHVTMPRIQGASVAGSGNMTVDRAEGTNFSADLAGSGNLTVGGVRVSQAELNVAGSGNIRMSGEAQAMEINIAGSGDVDTSGLRAGRGEVSIAGSGNVLGNVTGPAKVSIMGSGDVNLGPQARCEVSKMGSGNVRCAR